MSILFFIQKILFTYVLYYYSVKYIINQISFSQPVRWRYDDWGRGGINLSFNKIKCWYSIVERVSLKRKEMINRRIRKRSNRISVNRKMVKVFIFLFCKRNSSAYAYIYPVILPFYRKQWLYRKFQKNNIIYSNVLFVL